MPDIMREKGDLDGDEKQSQELTTPAFPVGKTLSREQWTTTRVELWAFYVYYIVCHVTNDLVWGVGSS